MTKLHLRKFQVRIGQRVRTMREVRGFSQEALAHKLGCIGARAIDLRWVEALERGEQTVGPAILAGLSLALDTPVVGFL